MNKKENPADQNSYPIVDQFNSENLIPILSCGKENSYKHPFCILPKSYLIVVHCGLTTRNHGGLNFIILVSEKPYSGKLF